MKLLLTLLFLIPLVGFAQSSHNYEYSKLYLPTTNGSVEYQSVGEAPGQSADQLYATARLWFAEKFNSSKEVIEYESKADGIIAGNGNMTLMIKSMGIPIETSSFFSIRIEVKDGKYRYLINNISLSNSVNTKVPIEQFFSQEWMYKKNGSPRPVSFEWYDVFEREIRALEASIHDTMSKKPTKDW